MSYYLANLNLNMLVVLDAVCRFKHMTRAAKELNLSQPAVSRYMKELKEVVGQDLFIKTIDGVEITPDGMDLWHQAIEILDRCEYVRRYSETDFDPLAQKWTFDVAVPLINTRFIMDTLVMRLRKEFPLIHLNLIQLNLDQAIQNLKTRHITAYIGFLPENLESALEHEKINDAQYTLICSKNSPLYGQKEITKSQFIKAPHVTVYTGVNDETSLDRELKRHGLYQNIRYNVPDMASMVQMVRNTDTVFITERNHAEILKAEYSDIHSLEPVNFNIPHSEFHLIWNKNNTMYRPHKWFRQYVLEHVR